jgi:raffinose/stachyose/melibiose transport system substrate-binding protein
MNGKKVLATLVVLLVSAGLLCAGGQQEGAEQEKEAAAQEETQEQVELHFFQFKPYLDEQYKDFADEFEQEYPNVTVNTETIGGGTQWQTILKSKFAAGEGPDIFPVEGVGQYELWQEYIADLSGEPWIDNAVPFALEGLNIDGKQMGMPVNLEGYGYIYNKKIFEEAGVNELPETLSELRAAAEKIEAAGYTPFGTGYSTWWVIGLHLVNVAFAQQDDPQGFIDALNAGEASMADNELFQDLKNVVDLTVEYGEKNPLTTDHNKQVQMFANGQVAMIQQGVWKEMPIMEANADADIGLLPVPLNNSSQMDRIPVGVPFNFVVNKTSSENVQKAAKNFLNFLVNTETGQSYMTEEFGFIPAYKGVDPKGLHGVGKDILAYADKDKTIPWVFGKFPDGFANEVTKNVQAYIADRQDWDTVLENMDSKWQELK